MEERMERETDREIERSTIEREVYNIGGTIICMRKGEGATDRVRQIDFRITVECYTNHRRCDSFEPEQK
jgi:hypothetical protein